jgi:hypothetical protein
LQQAVHLGPQFLPGLPLGVGQLGDGLLRTHAGQAGVVLSGPHYLPGSHGIPACPRSTELALNRSHQGVMMSFGVRHSQRP